MSTDTGRSSEELKAKSPDVLSTTPCVNYETIAITVSKALAENNLAWQKREEDLRSLVEKELADLKLQLATSKEQTAELEIENDLLLRRVGGFSKLYRQTRARMSLLAKRADNLEGYAFWQTDQVWRLTRSIRQL